VITDRQESSSEPRARPRVLLTLISGLAQWLIDAGLSPSAYVAAQGSAMQRAGRVYLRRSGNDVWVGGDVVDCITGEVDF